MQLDWVSWASGTAVCFGSQHKFILVLLLFLFKLSLDFILKPWGFRGMGKPMMVISQLVELETRLCQ
jgi:hypothetical protein